MRLHEFERLWNEPEDKGIPVIVDLDRITHFTSWDGFDHGLPVTTLLLSSEGERSVSVMASVEEVRALMEARCKGAT